MLTALRVCALLALLCSAAPAQEPLTLTWQPATGTRPLSSRGELTRPAYVPTAATQSPAIVRIWARQAQFSSGGSGTLIAKDETGRGLIITNRHVIDEGGRIEIHWPTGEQSVGKVEAIGQGADDLAAVFVQVPEGIEPLELREDEPAQDETLWMAGYGGSHQAFAFGPGSYDPKDPVNAEIQGTPARHGDSGGPIIDAKNRVAGVLWGSTGDYGGRETVLIRLPRVRQFLRKVGTLCQFSCGPCGRPSRQQAQPFDGGDAPEVLGGNGGFASDPDEPGLPGEDDLDTVPVAPPKPKADPKLGALEKQLEELTKKLDALAAQQPVAGPPGPAGPAGPPGPPGEPGAGADEALLVAIAERIATIEKQLADKPALAERPSPALGPLTGTPKISHIVLLVDKSAPEWARIAGTFLDRAQDVLPVRIVDYSEVPWKVKQLPQAIVYNTAHEPVSVAKGYRDVELTLAAVDRGDLQ